MTAAALFLSTFELVFLLGTQSLVVQADMRRVAFANSFAIGAANLVLFKLAPDAAGLELVAYLCGGTFGIVAAMEVFRRWRAKT